MKRSGRGPFDRSLAGGFLLLFGLAVGCTAVATAYGSLLPVPRWMVALGGFGIGLLAAGWLLSSSLRSLGTVLQALSDGVAGLRDGDFSLRLAVTRRDEIGELVDLYNQAVDLLRRERAELRQRELLLDTALQSSPTAVLLTDPGGRVVFSNQEARRLLLGGGTLEGLSLDELLDGCPPPLRHALEAGDGLFTVEQGSEVETYHATRRQFRLDRRPFDLLLLRRLTHELSREESKIWKRVIRILSHELNNSLAPVSSLVHSAGVLAERGELERLRTVLSGVEERVHHLAEFLSGYARYARLPLPRLEEVAWRPFLERLRRHTPFRLDIDTPQATGHFDPGQIEQVLLNLLKNAREASEASQLDAITVRLGPGPEATTRLEVLDRGTGMDERTLQQAFLPFFTTKADGVGVGLPLCRDILAAHGGRLAIRQREGGGTRVACTFPPG